MTYDVLRMIMNQKTINIVIEIENDELWKFGFQFIWVLNKIYAHVNKTYIDMVEIILIEQAKELNM
jgi:hypothetical protein